MLLVVAEKTASGWTTLAEATRVTALGEGVRATGVLAEDRMQDTLAAIVEFAEFATTYDAPLRTAATMAVRIATNAAEFVSRGARQGTPILVLSGDDEAQLGFLSVANDPAFAQHSRLSIIDPGGHSTELVTADREGSGWNVRFRRSYPVGTLGLKSQSLSAECPNVLQLLRAVEEIDDLIGLVYLPRQAGHAVTLGATGTNLVSIREQMLKWQPERVHGAWLDYEEVSKTVGWMMPLPESERAAIPGIEPGREKTLPHGALILERFLHVLRVLGCSVSVRGWRHAMLEKDEGW